jgi:ubiquinone/menaquinone biosynthesis C-methylase UbiE
MKKLESTYYDEFYSQIFSSGILGWAQNIVHRKIDRSFIRKDFDKVLEVGAGNLEHVLNANFLNIKLYVASDIRISKTAENLKRKASKDSNLAHVKIQRFNAEKIPYPKDYFDGFIATCLLIHLKNPLKALEDWRRVMKTNGEMVIYVPCDPGVVLRLGRKLAVIPKHFRLGNTNYKLLCALEHKTSLYVLDQYIKEVYSKDQIRIKTWPVPGVKFWNFNLAFVYHIQIKK